MATAGCHLPRAARPAVQPVVCLPDLAVFRYQAVLRRVPEALAGVPPGRVVIGVTEHAFCDAPCEMVQAALRWA
ncbi:MAG: hypothetical protein ACOY3F_08840 [Bacillota bacterium]